MSAPAAAVNKYSLPTGVSIKEEECPHHQAVLAGKGVDEIDARVKATLLIENGPTIEGCTPVHVAALVGAVDFLKAVAVGALGPCVESGRSSAEFAARGNQVEALKVLAERGAPINDPNSNDVTPLWVAAQCGSLAVVKELIARNVSAAACVKKPAGHTLLHGVVASLAPIADRVAVLEYLLSLKTIDVDALAEISNDRGEKVGSATAFALACGLQEEGSIALVEALFRADGHKTNLADAAGSTVSAKQAIVKLAEGAAPQFANKDEQKNSIVFQRRKGFPVMPTMMGGSDAPAPVMNQALPAPAAAAATDSSKKEVGAAAAAAAAGAEPASPAAAAKQENATYVVKLDKKRDRVNAPLHAACQAQRLDVVKFLVEKAGFECDKSALVGVKDQVTPFYLAIRYAGADAATCNLDVATYLVDKCRVDIDKQCSDGATALYGAAFFNLVGPLKFLIERSASTSMQYKGATPLFGAIAGDAVDAARMLIKANADQLTTYKSMSLAAYARSEGRDKLIALFAEENIN